MVSVSGRLDARGVARPWARSAASSARGIRTATTLLLVATVYAAMSQGAYYPGQLRVTFLLVLAALAVALVATGVSRADFGAPTVACIGLGGWYLVAGGLAHDVSGALPAVELVIALAATVAVVRRAAADERRVLLAGLIAMGCVLALVGWEGVAWRQAPRALVDGGLWRAASTITYANATAGLLATLAVLALGWSTAAQRTRERMLLSVGAFVLLVGLFATASRAGLLALAAGLAWLTVRSRGKLLRCSWNVVLGAAVAAAALVPSMLVAHAEQPALAVAGLVIGGVLATVPSRIAGVFVAVTAFACSSVLAAFPGARADVSRSLHELRGDRATVSSPDRSNELHAALRLAGSHPLAGVGPGQVDLTWSAPAPAGAPATTMHEEYAHNEYVQTLVEVGVPGLLLLLGGLGAVALAIRRSRRTVVLDANSGAVAALVVLAVHSSFDFLWHVPIVPLVAAVIVGTLLTESHPDTYRRAL